MKLEDFLRLFANHILHCHTETELRNVKDAAIYELGKWGFLILLYALNFFLLKPKKYGSPLNFKPP